MEFTRVLIANRGEIAVRIARAAAALQITSVAVYASDDRSSGHVDAADQAVVLSGEGPRAYLNASALVQLALDNRCEAIHPGYGFLSESAEFATLCEQHGLVFVGPTPSTLELLGDKTRALRLAEELDVPVLAGLRKSCSENEALAFLQSRPAGTGVMIKAVAGGGGRGMRVVNTAPDLPAAFRQCQAEAQASFGQDALYVEELLPRARHIEIQIVGDGQQVTHLGERECSLQRARQKLMEVAPSPSLTERERDALTDAAQTLAQAVHYRGVGTFEFLLIESSDKPRFVFMEANPRLQVEHTVTEEVMGVDLVQMQLQLAQGATLDEIGLNSALPPRGFAIQLRLNAEQMSEDSVMPSAGTLRSFSLPGGPGVRVDTFAYTGYTINPRYDSLLAKVITHTSSPDFGQVIIRARRALAECRIDGVSTNIAFLQALLDDPAVVSNRVHTRFIDENLPALLSVAARFRPSPASVAVPEVNPREVNPRKDKPREDNHKKQEMQIPSGCEALRSPLNGTIVDVMTAPGETVAGGQELLIIEAMKMQYAIVAPGAARVRTLAAVTGELVEKDQLLVLLDPQGGENQNDGPEQAIDLDEPRADLAEVLERIHLTMDGARSAAVEKRHALGLRTARENVEDLCDPGYFVEYGGLTIAAQKARRPLDDLIRQTPADGLVAGIGGINAELMGEQRARCLLLAYDYTVLAGTQGPVNHRKTDRVLSLARRLRLPVVLFAEGGGGRPGDTDNATKVAGLDVPTFQRYAQLSGLVPRIAIVAGRCFAGNAAMAGCSDLIIGVEGCSLGMGGPAMIEGGGLGVFHPDEVGPASMQSVNGVLDLLVADEAEAVRQTKTLMAIFQGNLPDWQCGDQRELRWTVPENRLRAYDIRALIKILADTDSVIELRRQFAPGMVTAFIRVEGRPLGLIANVPTHDGGAIDADGSDKAARFMQLCDAFNIPLLCLCDTPGFLVGPQAEATALVRHTSRMFVTAASMEVPVLTIVLRKGYGLGAMAMAAGGFHHTAFTVAWPTGEFGGMGLEGGVRLGFRKELDAQPDEASRRELYDMLVAEAYERGKALSTAVSLEIDAVIDPAESRRWIGRTLAVLPAPHQSDAGKKRPFVDTW